jgi:phage protein U
MIIGALGMIPFVGGLGTANTFHEIAKTNKTTYVKHQIISGVDLIEATGPDPIDLSVQMSFFAPYTLSPSVSVVEIEALAASRLPVPLFAGDAPVGRGLLTLFVIEDVSVQMRKWVGSNLAIAAVTVKLLEYSNPLSIAGPLNALASLGASVSVGPVNASIGVSF